MGIRRLGVGFSVAFQIVFMSIAAEAAIITFSNDVFDVQADVLTSGVSVVAFNLGTAVDVTVNGVVFAADPGGSVFFSSGGNDYVDGNLYTGDAIAGLNASDTQSLLDSCEYGPGTGNSIARLNGLQIGKSYLFQVVFVDDRAAYMDMTMDIGYATPSGSVTENYVMTNLDHSSSSPLIVTGTFTADETVQDIHIQHSGGGALNGLAQAFQLRGFGITNEPQQRVKVFLLGGQSNMAGVGNNSDLPQPYSQPQNNIKYWNGLWVPTAPGFGHTATQFGPEIMFAKMLGELLPDDDVRLVKYAVSGSNLAVQWNPETGPFYSNFKTKAEAALADLAAKGIDYRVEGMIWMQGESDAIDYADTYETNLLEFIAAVRDDFGSNDMPFVLGRITTHFDSSPTGGNAIVRATQVSVASSQTNVAWFDTDACQIASYNAGHYDAVGQLDVGGLFAYYMLKTMRMPVSNYDCRISILDSSFEIASVAESGNGASPNWFDATGSTVYDPSDADFDGTTGGAADAAAGGTNSDGVLPEGGQVAFAYDNSKLSQTLDSFVQPMGVYTLELSVGQWKKTTIDFSQYRIRLLAGGHPIIDALSADINGGVMPQAGEFDRIILTGQADVDAHGVLSIVLESTESGRIAFFDDVHLSVIQGTLFSVR